MKDICTEAKLFILNQKVWVGDFNILYESFCEEKTQKKGNFLLSLTLYIFAVFYIFHCKTTIFDSFSSKNLAEM